MNNQINKIDQFLAYTNSVMDRQLQKLDASPFEKTAIKLGIYNIFERDFDAKRIYKDVLNYFTERNDLNYIIPEIEKYLPKLK